ncbi:sulfite exporter TauE/SafE family protein [Methanocaldococcus infernus]
MIALIIIGSIIGLISSLLGISGGFLLVPILYHYFISLGVPSTIAIKMAIGTSLFTIFLNSLFSLYFSRDQLDLRSSLHIGIFGIFGSFIGAYLTIKVFPEYVIKKIFGFFLIILSIYLIFKKYKDIKNFQENICNKKLSLLGFITGILSSMLGIGGGIIVIPSLNILLSIPIKRAITISIGMISIITFPGVIVYMLSPIGEFNSLYNIGYVSLSTSLTLLPFCIIFSKVGSQIKDRINTKYLRYLLAIFILIGGLRMIT